MTYTLTDFVVAFLAVFAGMFVMAALILISRRRPNPTDTYRPPNSGYQPRGPKNHNPGEPPHAGSSGRKD